jgi:hypothetical protein
LIKVEANKIDLARLKTAMIGIKKNADPIVYRAINKSIGINRTFSIDQAYKILNLTKTYIRNRFKKSGNWLELKAGPNRLFGQYWTIGRPIGFINFIGTKELKSGGVSVKILRSGNRSKIKHAFIRKIRGAENVFEREPDTPPRGYRTPARTREQYAGFMEKTFGRQWRYKLHRMAGPRLQDILADPAIYHQIDSHAVETFQRKLDEQLAYELSKL